jgi:mono/diheme cytochrome c family protein
MFRLRSPVSACVLLSACLAATVAANAQTKPKTAPKSTAAPKEKEPAKKSADAEKAEEGYKTVCQACHLADGKGLTPDMSFTDGVWKHGTTTEAMAKVIAEGVPGTVMLPYKDRFTKEEILELVKIVRSFDPKLKGKK